MRGEPARLAGGLQAALGALDFIRQRRTARQREIVAAVGQAPTARAAADALKVSPQTVSRALAAAGYAQAAQLALLIDDLAADAADAVHAVAG